MPLSDKLRVFYTFSLLLRNGIIGWFLLVAAFLSVVPAHAVTPLVSAQWVLDNIAQKDMVIVDLQPVDGYKRIHLPRAVNTQYAQWRHRKPVEGKALPDIDYLEKLLGSLGITPESHIVLTPVGLSANEVAVATRIYWTLKVLGHEKVSILDGGLIAYSKLPTPAFTNQPTTISPVSYKATPNFDMAPAMADVFKEWQKGTSFIDYRSPQEFFGKVAGPRPGTIPGSKNLPFDALIEPKQGGKFLGIEKLKALFAAQNIDPERPHIGFCNSGHRASLAWFVTHELLGNKKGHLYDGSISEWQQYPQNPIEIPN